MRPLIDTVRALDHADLAGLHRAVEHELADAVRRGQPAGSHVRLLDQIESRLARGDVQDTRPTLQRRQLLAAERGNRHPARAESGH